jgi:hypothetical protein
LRRYNEAVKPPATHMFTDQEAEPTVAEAIAAKVRAREAKAAAKAAAVVEAHEAKKQAKVGRCRLTL